MQDIPRNELLDKLAAGWKVRVKGYHVEGNMNDLRGLFELKGMDIECLIDRNWEGIPHEPELKYRNQTITAAIKCLNTGAAFIRRSDWRREKITLKTFGSGFTFTLRDILNEDWEVWG